jgi:glycosyltransferase involved in cell wall biosynthesis
MKVALIHDHLAQDGGAEKVLQVFCDMYREAPIYTLLYEPKNVEKNYKNRHIETSIIQKMPGGVKHYRWYLVFMPMAVEFFDLRPYDVVISDASAFAKGVITSTKTLHICYCHTPTRYLWSDTHQYINELHYNKYFKKIIALSLSFLRMWDHGAADRVDYYIANSNFIAKRIKKYYNRDSAVIYPPVEVDNFYISESLGDYYLIGARLVPYKRFDIVIEAFKKNGKKLKIYGDGIDGPRLKKLAEGYGNIEFLGRVSDEERAKLMAECLAFIHAPEEDFGITIVEAQASGRPVIAYDSGGAKELIKQGVTGEFFPEQTADSLQLALDVFDPTKYAPSVLRAHAETFSTERFKQEIESFVAEKQKEYFS